MLREKSVANKNESFSYNISNLKDGLYVYCGVIYSLDVYQIDFLSDQNVMLYRINDVRVFIGFIKDHPVNSTIYTTYALNGDIIEKH